MLIDRRQAAELGRETVSILEAGRYTTADGAVVEIRDLLSRAVAGTLSYPPDCDVPPPRAGEHATSITVSNETTLEAARQFIESGHRPAVLNFASATHPGGGFRSGARAQEESLARSSGLFACLNGNEMYELHRARQDALYTDYVIYSPNVPVIRTDAGALIREPCLCCFITSPAVNANAVRKYQPDRSNEIQEAMRTRIAKVLRVAADHGHEMLVLGAWGCGAFGNDTRTIAELFHSALFGEFRGVFARVVFAITDWSTERRFIGPFRQLFGGGNST